jgi:hypothetical protein
MSDRNYWLVPLTGVAFIVLAIVTIAIGGEPPEAKEGAQKVVDHYADNKDSIQISSMLATIAGAALIFFFGYVRKVLRAAEGENGMLSLVAFVGAAILATGIAIDSTIAFALAESADDIEPVAAQALQALWDNDFMPFALGTIVLLLASGLSIVRHGALPKWLGWIAIVLGVIGMTPIGFVGLLGAAVWVLIVSVMLTLRARAAQAPPPGGQTSLTG